MSDKTLGLAALFVIALMVVGYYAPPVRPGSPLAAISKPEEITTRSGWMAASEADRAIHVHGLIGGWRGDRAAAADWIAACTTEAVRRQDASRSVTGAIDTCMRLWRPG